MVELIALSLRSGRPTAIATFQNFCVSHGTTARFLRGGEKCYIYFAYNSLLFPKLNYSQNRLTVHEFIAKSSTPHF